MCNCDDCEAWRQNGARPFRVLDASELADVCARAEEGGYESAREEIAYYGSAKVREWYDQRSSSFARDRAAGCVASTGEVELAAYAADMSGRRRALRDFGRSV